MWKIGAVLVAVVAVGGYLIGTAIGDSGPPPEPGPPVVLTGPTDSSVDRGATGNEAGKPDARPGGQGDRPGGEGDKPGPRNGEPDKPRGPDGKPDKPRKPEQPPRGDDDGDDVYADVDDLDDDDDGDDDGGGDDD